MEYVWIAVILVVLALGAFMLFRKNHRIDTDTALVTNGRNPSLIPIEETGKDLIVKMEMLPSLSEVEEASLVEVTDSKVLARIDQVVPGLAQSGTAAATAVQANGQVLYQAIIPAGAKLTNSKAMEGAVRGIYHGADGIQGHANLVAVNQTTTAVANTAAAAMGVASMVVGQYYMTQINAELSEINDGIEKISNFQDNEYKSKVFTLVAQVKKIASFQVEIIDNPDLRASEIEHLNKLEDECSQLLGQANLTLSDYCKKNSLDYEAYEKELREAQNWYVYQQTLLDVLCKIADLKYTLYLGTVSRNQCGALLPTYTKQVADAQSLLTNWHEKNVSRLGIDTSESKRKRAGFDYALHWIPGRFNDDFNFRPVAEKTVKMIETQVSGSGNAHSTAKDSLYDNDVRLISKNGKIYYLPENNSTESNDDATAE